MNFSAKHVRRTKKEKKRESEKRRGEGGRKSDELVTKLRIKNTKKDESAEKRG